MEYDNERTCDRFTLGIPYCGSQVYCKLVNPLNNYVNFYDFSVVVLSGEMVFDRRNLDDPPDVIFSAEDDELDFDPDIEKLTVG